MFNLGVHKRSYLGLPTPTLYISGRLSLYQFSFLLWPPSPSLGPELLPGVLIEFLDELLVNKPDPFPAVSGYLTPRDLDAEEDGMNLLKIEQMEKVFKKESLLGATSPLPCLSPSHGS